VISDLSGWKQVVAYCLAAGAVVGVISFLAFLAVTLRKGFELTTPWETLAYFVIVLAGLVILARLSGLHESR
jgi:hypothetical protein